MQVLCMWDERYKELGGECGGVLGASRFYCERNELVVWDAACGMANEKRYEGINKLLVLATVFDISLLSPLSIWGKVWEPLDKGLMLVSLLSLLSIQLVSCVRSEGWYKPTPASKAGFFAVDLKINSIPAEEISNQGIAKFHHSVSCK